MRNIMLKYKGGKHLKEELLNIDNVKKHVIYNHVDWTNHCLNRLNQRNISLSDVKCGISDNYVHIITAYRPDRDKWEEDMKTRRGK